MLAGHAQYVKGYVAETIGSVTGSKEWTESGKQNEEAGIATMKVCFLPLLYPLHLFLSQSCGYSYLVLFHFLLRYTHIRTYCLIDQPTSG
jgi:hypothetical protein